MTEEERELPVGWESCRLGDVLEYGKTIKAEPETISDDAWILELEDIEKDTSRLLQKLDFSERKSKSTKNTFFAGDVLYGKLRPYLNKVLLADAPGYCSTEIIPLSPGGQLSSGYLFYWLKSPEFLGYTSEVSHGINMPRLGTEAGLKAPFILAPLNEQRRIAAKLDTTLAAVDACRQRLDGVEALLKRFRQAVLAAATSGELTREWREENGEEETKRLVRLGDVILEMRNGLSPKPSLTPPGVKILRIGAIRPGLVDFEDYRYLDLAPRDAEHYALRDGDLIFTRYNGTLEFVGVCALVKSVPCTYVYPDKLIRVRCKEEVALPAYVELAFGSAAARDQIESLVKSSAGQKGVSGTDLKGVRLSLPSIPEQQEVIRRTQELFSLADQLEARLTAARRIVERLTPALLAKAFRGELVPQDPNDEPASALLERIRAARQAEAAAAGPSRRGRNKAAANPAPSPVDAAPVTPDQLAKLLRECGALSEKALLAASELEPARFRAQLELEVQAGRIRQTWEDGEDLWEAVG